MFGRQPKAINVKLDAAVVRLLDEMQKTDPGKPEYTELLTKLERVTQLHESKDRKGVTPDTMALVTGNLLGILIIVAYEQKHIIGSKGLGFILRPR